MRDARMHPVHVLDNPVWHALSGPQSTVAEGNELALRYDPAVSVFAAVPDEATPESWDALRALVGPGGTAIVARDVVPLPPGWTELFRAAGTQMVCDQPVSGAPALDGLEIEVLTPAAVPEMMDLVERAQPGPMLVRTIELGTYVGIRDEGALVALAGTRVRLPGYTEISAVCTDDAHRGLGLGKLVVARMVDEILGRGEIACLHAVSTNTPAIRLYETLGFTTRREMDFALLGAPA
ncbi:MAG: GNAT family N-acetyltransferase [Acidimicrobiia bacterium]